MQTQVIFEQNASAILPNGQGRGRRKSKVAVLFTSEKATRAAVEAVSDWTEQREACLEILVMQRVPFPEALDHPTRIDPNIRLAAAIANDAAKRSVTVSVYLCRDIIDGMSYAVDRETPVVIGVRNHWRWSWERRIAMKLMDCGYRIYCVGDPVTVAKSLAGSESLGFLMGQ